MTAAGELQSEFSETINRQEAETGWLNGVTGVLRS